LRRVGGIQILLKEKGGSSRNHPQVSRLTRGRKANGTIACRKSRTQKKTCIEGDLQDLRDMARNRNPAPEALSTPIAFHHVYAMPVDRKIRQLGVFRIAQLQGLAREEGHRLTTGRLAIRQGKGHKRIAYVTLVRLNVSHHGITYGARAGASPMVTEPS